MLIGSILIRLKKGKSVQCGLDNEQIFFQTKEPWSKITDRSLLGIPALKEKLAVLQIEKLKTTIPGILHSVVSQLEDAKSDLEDIGEDMTSTTNRRKVFEKVKMDIINMISTATQGKGMFVDSEQWLADDDHTLCARILALLDGFGESIMNTKLGNYDAPKLGEKVLIKAGLKNSGGMGIIGTLQGCSFRDDDGTKYCIVAGQDSNSIAAIKAIASGYSFGHDMSNVIGHDKKNYKVGDYCVPISLVTAYHGDWLRMEIQRTRCNSVPLFLNSDIFGNVISDLIKAKWHPTALTLFQNIITNCNNCFTWIAEHYVPTHQPGFVNWVQEQLKSVSNELETHGYDLIVTCVSSNVKCPYTNNPSLFETVFTARTAGLLTALEESTTRLSQGHYVDLNTIKALFKTHQGLGSMEHLVREMQLIISSYGKVAAKRFADDIPQIIESEYVQKIVNKASERLQVSDADLEHIIIESAATAKQRKDLVNKIDKFTGVVEKFRDVLKV